MKSHTRNKELIIQVGYAYYIGEYK
ncbi:hypothetical protein CGSSp9BS68_02438 [Streptococcus pneumoniae SP9-BS68]|nr:hypothetical protein CGSSp11BS70_02469 [Streptococcus pneumoniae SP11-BS70]EDK74525.1 hypothetical protein CGSSp3BS71_02842 [Streptococcus pneumoniae SP3-BS71]EDK77007.1 hypothetical protein CGSSp6BS73_09404 [Streptococcus pneumoniae SP6-BS73]EDK78723.1 hypothetical protein CGSSp9BS68_02438 [Streptococcus pneumoniae SP9-BS68]